MNAENLRNLQTPLKSQYKDDPTAAQLVLKAEGAVVQSELCCTVDTGFGVANAGLHPATGGDGTAACSGDMLLQALAACAGVTLAAVATAMEIELADSSVQVEGDLDFRGTLGVAKDVPVGFSEVRLDFVVDTDADQSQLESLLKLTERYCVVAQTLNGSANLVSTIRRRE